MSEKLRALNIPGHRIHVVPNWSDDALISPISADDNPLRPEWGVHHKFVVGYSGNMGRAHEFETVLCAAEILQTNPNILFLFVGGGHQFGKLAEAVKRRGLTNFRFIGYQNRERLKFSLGAPDVHLVSLKPELEGLIVPSKFYGIAAAGRPVIAICSPKGEMARLVQQHRCGYVVEPGNFKHLADAILELSSNTTLRLILGQRARDMLDAHFTRQQALERWRQVLSNVELEASSRSSH